MKRIWLAGALGTAALLSGCGGGGNQEATPSETPSATDTAALLTEAAPTATDTVAPSDTASAAEASATPTPTPAATHSAAPAMAAAVAPAGPPEAFKQCAICHSVEPGKNGIGPSLADVYGAKAGQVPGYDFSDAMKNSGLTFNEATLDKFLTSPRDVVPGTKMSFAGLKDADKRSAVIAYLKSL